MTTVLCSANTGLFFITDKDADFFQCSWGKIPITLRCDGTNNCGDNSDEESCEKGNIHLCAICVMKILISRIFKNATRSIFLFFCQSLKNGKINSKKPCPRPEKNFPPKRKLLKDDKKTKMMQNSQTN